MHITLPNVYLDPVCAMEVSADSAKLRSTYQSHTYYFCAEGCKKAFEKAPEKYLTSKPEKKKGWWGKHVDRLKDAVYGWAHLSGL